MTVVAKEIIHDSVLIIEVTIVKVFEKKLSLHQEAKSIRMLRLVSI